MLHSRWKGQLRHYAFRSSEGGEDDGLPEVSSASLLQYIGRPQITEAWSEELADGTPYIRH